MSVLIDTPFKVFFDANGDPLDEGYVYIGVAGLNPITNPLVVYWDAELSIPATNIRTVNGFPSYRGAPGNIYTSVNYSILVKNRQGAIVYSNLNNANYMTDAKKIFGDYNVETVVIAGTTDKKLIFVNRQTGKSFTLTETQSPAGVTTEAVHRLGALSSTTDWRFDFALHNKDAGVMKGLHLLQCYNDDATAAMYWVFRHRPAGETDYGTLEDYYMMKLDETAGLQVNTALSEGVAPTWVSVMTKDNLATELAANWSTALLTALGAGWSTDLARSHTYQAISPTFKTLISSPTGRSSTSVGVYEKKKEILIDRGGTVRVSFTLGSLGADGTAYGVITVNGIVVGTERNIHQGTTTFIEDITVAANDLIQIQIKTSRADRAAVVSDFIIGASPVGLFVTLD